MDTRTGIESGKTLAKPSKRSLRKRCTHALLKKTFTQYKRLDDYIDADVPASSRHAWPRRVLLPSGIEITLGMLLTAVCYYYMDPDTPEYANPFIITSMFLAFNVGARIPDPDKKITDDLLTLLRSFSVTAIDFTTKGVALHEACHSLIAWLLFNKADPKFTYESILSGKNPVTHYNTNELSSLGEMLGDNNSRLAVSLAGATGTMLCAYANLILAQFIHNPEIKLGLRLTALAYLIMNLGYTCTVLINCQKGNDFCDATRRSDVFSWEADFAYMLTSMILVQLTLSFGNKIGNKCVNAVKNKCHKQRATLEEIIDIDNDEKGYNLDTLFHYDDEENQYSLIASDDSQSNEAVDNSILDEEKPDIVAPIEKQENGEPEERSGMRLG